MAFTKVEFEKDWTRAEDFPAYQDSEAQVREDLQYHPNALRNFINKLIRELEAKNAAGALGAVNADGAADTIQNVLNSHNEELARLAEEISAVVSGGVQAALRNVAVTFEEDSWAVAGETAALTIPKSDHARENENFGYNLYQLVDGTYLSGTEGTAATRVSYSSDGSIVLMTDEPYRGKIVLFGT